MKTNQSPIDPQIEQCVSQVQEFVISPALRQTVTTTYCKLKEDKVEINEKFRKFHKFEGLN